MISFYLQITYLFFLTVLYLFYTVHLEMLSIYPHSQPQKAKFPYLNLESDSVEDPNSVHGGTPQFSCHSQHLGYGCCCCTDVYHLSVTDIPSSRHVPPVYDYVSISKGGKYPIIKVAVYMREKLLKIL